MTIKSLYPASRPALGLDFAKTKRLDPRVTFTRASTATFVGADGLIKTAVSGAARFDHNPATGESLGLLVEEARTNLALRSEELGALGLHGAGVITPDFGISPSGSLNARRLSPGAGAGPHGAYFYNANAYAPNGWQISAYVKPLGLPKLGIRVDNGVWGNQYPANVIDFNSLTFSDTVFGSNQSLLGQSITNVGNGWYRVVWRWFYSVNGGSALSFICGLSTSGNHGAGQALWNFDGTPYVNNGFLIWGIQIENAAFPTSYIPTVASTVTRAAEVATLSNANSSVFPTSAFTTVNTPFGTAGGGSTVKLVGPTIKRTAIYAGDLPQAQINALAGVNDNFWRWRVLGSSFALPNFTTDGSVTVDWGDGTVQTLTTAVRTFANGGGYHDIGFRLNSGTFFRPNINLNATYKDRVIAVGPAPASMKVNLFRSFGSCAALRQVDGYIDASQTENFYLSFTDCTSLTSFPMINTGTIATSYAEAWRNCSSLTSFPAINTAVVTDFGQAWAGCSGLTSFPLINVSATTSLSTTWSQCSSLTSFPLINTSAVTNLSGAWNQCSALASFPLINTSAVTNFSSAWRLCSALTPFPLINTGAGTNFQQTWQGCSSLTSFPLINTAAGTNFYFAWLDCTGLTSFPAISMASGTNFNGAWNGCTNLSSFPANMFNTTGTLVATAFFEAFRTCALTAASIENILTSLVTNGQSNITLGLQGGTNAGASTWTANAVTAYNTLISRGWAITRNA